MILPPDSIESIVKLELVEIEVILIYLTRFKYKIVWNYKYILFVHLKSEKIHKSAEKT